MKILLICPIPVEYNTCRKVLSLKDISPISGCRAGRTSFGNLKITAIESGPTKARAASAAVSGIVKTKPHLVIDTGSCCGIEDDLSLGKIVFSPICFEHDIRNRNTNRNKDKNKSSNYKKNTSIVISKATAKIPEIGLPSGLLFLKSKIKNALLKNAIEQGKNSKFDILTGSQTCGEIIVQSLKERKRLYSLFRSAGFNWETAGVFISSLRCSIPPLSMRIITDLGDMNALSIFRQNSKKLCFNLYTYILLLIKNDWFLKFHEAWLLLQKSDPLSHTYSFPMQQAL